MNSLFGKSSGDVKRQPKTLHELMEQKLLERGHSDQVWFGKYSTALSAISGFSGLLINSAIRRHLMVYESVIVSSFTVAFVGSIFNYGARRIFVEDSLMEGRLVCGTCAVIRGAIIQAVTASLIPGILAYTICGIVADKFKSVNMPELGIPPSKEYREFFKREASKLLRPVRISFLFQVGLGGIFTYKQYLVARDLHSSITREELHSLWQETALDLRGAMQ